MMGDNSYELSYLNEIAATTPYVLHVKGMPAGTEYLFNFVVFLCYYYLLFFLNIYVLVNGSADYSEIERPSECPKYVVAIFYFIMKFS